MQEVSEKASTALPKGPWSYSEFRLWGLGCSWPKGVHICHMSSLGPKYILCSYMDPLGKALSKASSILGFRDWDVGFWVSGLGSYWDRGP